PHVRITKAGQRYPVRGQLLTPAVHLTGYPQGYLSVEGKTVPRKVHALVAEAFIGPRPEGHQIAHNDGDRLNSRLENLRYATAAEIAVDQIAHGRAPRGSRNGRAKLTEGQVLEIRRRR